MADTTFDVREWMKSRGGLGWLGFTNTPADAAKIAVFGSASPEGFDSWTLNSAAGNYLSSWGAPTEEEYIKAFSVFKDNPAEYYKSAVTGAAKNYGHMASMESYFGGGQDKWEKENFELIAKEAVEKGYLKPDEVVSLATPAYEQAYIKQSGYNNPDLRSSNGLFGQTLGRITSNPISTLLFPVAAAGAMGAFSAAGAGGTDYLGSQALGSAETGAVGTGSTGFGINAGASGVGINAGTGSLLATAPVDSGFGISTTPPAGNFGEFNPNIGSGTTGSSGIGIDTGAATEGYLGAGSATDAASTSGLGYLGGADALPTGTAGLTTNVAADAGVSASDVLRGVNAVKSLLASPEVPQQPTGNKSFVPKGNVNYDPLLNLLTMRASTPNLLSLLG
jgi:hypothetical protein